jgi:hypothetical protein
MLLCSACAPLTVPPPLLVPAAEQTPAPPVVATQEVAIQKTLTSIAPPQRVIHVSAILGNDHVPCTTCERLVVKTVERGVVCSRVNEDIILDDATIEGCATFRSGGKEGKPIRIIASQPGTTWTCGEDGKPALDIRGGFVQLHGVVIDWVKVNPPKKYAAGLAFFRSEIARLDMDNVGSSVKDPGVPANLIEQSKIGKAEINGFAVQVINSDIEKLELNGARHFFRNVEVDDAYWNAKDTLMAGTSKFLRSFHLGPDGDNPVFANTEFHGFMKLGIRGRRTVIGPMFFQCLWRTPPEQVNVQSFMSSECLTFEEKLKQEQQVK